MTEYDPLSPHTSHVLDPHAEMNYENELMLQKPTDAGDAERLKKKQIEHAQAERERLEFIRTMMTLPRGRKWLWRLLQECRTNSELIVVGDTHLTYYNMGRRNIGQFILQDLQRFPESYLLMCQENS